MPSLNWIGKDKVQNYHREVPFRVLEKKYSYGTEDENMIIHGDNLEALKSLLPRYEGRIKCIYIDPPYNTGNEGWVYNDNVNDPKIRDWIGKVVGKEGEDLSRHDKWLCLMYPRLRLLQKLLSDDGAIFISIDDNELYNLKQICDEIFGYNCFVAKITWQNNYSLRNDAKGIPYETDNILVYGKKPEWQPKRLARTEEMNARYVNYDNDINSYKVTPIHAPGASTHKGMVYAIQHPITGKLMYPPKGRHWKDSQDKLLDIMNEWAPYELKNIDDIEIRTNICGGEVSPDTQAIMLTLNPDESRAIAMKRYNTFPWPQYFFLAKGEGSLQAKTYLDNTKGKVVSTLWKHEDVGSNVEATNELKYLLDEKTSFETPKPVRLLERIIEIATDNDSIILDSFAGSGTTAHAVLNANKSDGGSRKFILVEVEDYADNTTAKRVKKVIDGYNVKDKVVPGTGEGFSYYELGTNLFLNNGSLNPEIREKTIKEYIWYMETRSTLKNNDYDYSDKYFLGIHNGTAYYFNYENSAQTILDNEFLKNITVKADTYVIFADICNIAEDRLSKYNIIFKKIPRDIARL